MTIKDELEEFIRTGKTKKAEKQRPNVVIKDSFVIIDMRPPSLSEQERPHPQSSNIIPLRSPRGR